MTGTEKGAMGGTYVTGSLAGEAYRAFVPPPLPPDPPLDLGPLFGAVDRAMQALGRLDGISSILPATGLFLYMYVRKEAVLSSQIEGTQSSLSDLLLYESEEAPGVPLDDVAEVSNYVAALHHGLDRLRGGFPLSLRLIREMHELLLAGGRGGQKQPGEFRRSQNRIGGTRPGNAVFVPPPPERLGACLDAFERFLHDESVPLPILVRAALAHVQFETIHPFLDGNGRLGRLLVTLLLCEAGVLREPTLYLSLFLKTHRSVYYDRLQGVRERGGWEAWLHFFLEGVERTANQAVDAAQRILRLFEQDSGRIRAEGRIAGSALQIHAHLQRHPIVSIPKTADAVGVSAPTVGKVVHRLGELGILREITGRQRGRLFAYDGYLKILSEGTEPLRP